MDQQKLLKQMIDFQKSTFDNAFNAMTSLQEQGEKMIDMFLNQASWLPDNGKQAVSNWIAAYKKGRENFKETVEKSFIKVEDFFQGTSETNTKAKPEAKPEE